MSPAEVGTAMHTIMQHIDIRKAMVRKVDKQITELADRQLLTEEEVKAVNGVL